MQNSAIQLEILGNLSLQLTSDFLFRISPKFNYAYLLLRYAKASQNGLQ